MTDLSMRHGVPFTNSTTKPMTKTIKAKPIANTIKAPKGFIPTRLKGKK